MRLIFGPVIFTLAFLLAPGQVLASESTDKICANATRHAEETFHLPRYLLFAISLKETGRWDDARKESYTWPWTVTSGGEGRHYPSKFAAIAEVKRLLAQGRTNIDVGCMQINLRYHSTGFTDLKDAFDPEKNAEYAARFLAELKERHGNWRAAVEHYHSSNPVRGKNYRETVSELQQQAFKNVNLTMPDPSTDNEELANAAQARADALTADALARRERHEREADRREELAAEARATAEADALRFRAEFEARKARRLAAWQKIKAERQAAAESATRVN